METRNRGRKEKKKGEKEGRAEERVPVRKEETEMRRK